MQEVFKNGSEGEVHVADTIEDLVPHIKKSLEDPNVKYVKVFRGILPENEKRVVAEEEKKNMIEQIIEDDKKEEEKKGKGKYRKQFFNE